MLSAIPAGFSGMPFPPFESGFTPWVCHFPEFSTDTLESVVMTFEPQPVLSSSGSDNSNPNPVSSGSGSDDPNDPNRWSGRQRCGTGTDSPLGTVIDERKRKRMISNRESARRSRMRKQKHLENQRAQVNRLNLENRELMNRVHLVTHHYRAVQSENERLQSELAFLRQKLWDMQRLLLVQELEQFPST